MTGTSVWATKGASRWRLFKGLTKKSIKKTPRSKPSKNKMSLSKSGSAKWKPCSNNSQIESKTIMKRLLLSFGLLLAISASAQTYSIDWFKIAGGGGTSTNGQYSLSGTIGQHDAGGPLTGGNYS